MNLIIVIFICIASFFSLQCKGQEVQVSDKVIIGPCTLDDSTKYPNYIVNDIKYKYYDYLKLNISKSNVEKIKVLGEKRARKKYGAFGDHGIIVIKTKE